MNPLFFTQEISSINYVKLTISFLTKLSPLKSRALSINRVYWEVLVKLYFLNDAELSLFPNLLTVLDYISNFPKVDLYMN